MQQSPYAYVLDIEGQPPAVFTWPNVCKKYIRDIYGDTLPPKDRLKLRRCKVNPRAGQTVITDYLDVEAFLAHR